MYGSHLTAHVWDLTKLGLGHLWSRLTLSFSCGCCIKTSLNLAKAKYFPDASPSDQLSPFSSC